MRKKVLSMLVSIVLLYVAGCSKYDGKIGLNTNPKPLNPTATPAAQPAVSQQSPVTLRPAQLHVGRNLTPLQEAENQLLNLDFWVKHLQDRITGTYDLRGSLRQLEEQLRHLEHRISQINDLKELRRLEEELKVTLENIRKTEDKVLELRAQATKTKSKP
jgi:peptidoglycan hydrolase CwlO-like protein